MTAAQGRRTGEAEDAGEMSVAVASRIHELESKVVIVYISLLNFFRSLFISPSFRT